MCHCRSSLLNAAKCILENYQKTIVCAILLICVVSLFKTMAQRSFLNLKYFMKVILFANDNYYKCIKIITNHVICTKYNILSQMIESSTKS